VTYVAKTAAKPYAHTAAYTGGEPRFFGELDPRTVRITDARPFADRLSLDREGLELRRHETAVEDFYDEDAVKRVYYAEVERLLKRVTGASRVLIFDHTRRTDAEGRRRGLREPAGRIHNDYT